MLHLRRKWFLYFYVFLLIYIEFGYRMVVVGQVSGTIRMLTLLFATSLLFLAGDKRIMPRAFILFIYCFVLVLLNLIIRGDNYSNYILLLIPILVGYAVSVSMKREVYIKVFCNVVYGLAIVSLMTYAANVIIPSFISMLPIINVLPSGAQIHDAFISVAITESINVRNFGLTWEPGAFALLLCLALYYLLVHSRETRTTKIIIITAAIITTYSTLGYLFMTILYTVVSINTIKSNIKHYQKKRATIIAIVCLLTFGLIIMPQHLKDLVFSKLNGLFTSVESVSITTQARIDAIVYPAQALIQSPLTGVGYDRFQYINEELCNSVATNTIVNWFALFGFPFGLPLTYYYLKNIYIDKDKNGLGILSVIMLLAAFCFLISTESLLRISLVYILIFYASNTKSIKKNRDVTAI